MFINDVGEVTWEEINDGIAGSNYGWPQTEGPTTMAGVRAPLFAYQHGSTSTTGCAITGGTFYNPTTASFPSTFVGKYFFADFCTNWIRVFDPGPGTATGFATALASPVDLRVASDGTLWYLQRGGSPAGQVHRIRFAENQPPAITGQPQNATVAAGQQVTFTVAASGSAPLSYQWQRGTTNIAGATSPTLTFTAAAGDNGATFRAVVTNAFGTATSNSATLTVSGGAPTATITTPAAGTTYAAGTTVTFSGTGTDPQDGTLPASAFTWEVVFHHDTHNHPFFPATSGITSGSVMIPNRGEIATNVFYRFHLTVRDSSGLTHTVTRDITPRLATVSLQTSPTGLGLLLDGTPVTAPASVPNVVGMIRSIGAPSPQTLAGTQYTFTSWSDGGAATHEITVPATNTTFTATYTAAPGGGPLANGTYRVRPTHVTNNTQCMDVNGASMTSGADVIQWTCHGGANQLWQFTNVGSAHLRDQAHPRHRPDHVPGRPQQRHGRWHRRRSVDVQRRRRPALAAAPHQRRHLRAAAANRDQPVSRHLGTQHKSTAATSSSGRATAKPIRGSASDPRLTARKFPRRATPFSDAREPRESCKCAHGRSGRISAMDAKAFVVVPAVALVLGLGCSAAGSNGPDAGSGGVGGMAGTAGVGGMAGTASDDLLVVPPGLSNTGEGGLLTLVAFTLVQESTGPALYAAVRNDGPTPACEVGMLTYFFDKTDQPVGEAGSVVLSGRFYRLPSGVALSCIDPGQIGMSASTGLPDSIVIGELGYLEHKFPYFGLEGLVAIAGLTVSGVETVMTAAGSAYTGTLTNELDVTVTDASVAIFPVNRVGRPLGMARSSATTDVAPGGSWSFQTGPVDDVGAGHVAYPGAAIPD